MVAATCAARLISWACGSQGYLPGQLYNLNSKFGNQEELKALVAACKEAGVRPMCECVFLLDQHHCASCERGLLLDS